MVIHLFPRHLASGNDLKIPVLLQNKFGCKLSILGVCAVPHNNT